MSRRFVAATAECLAEFRSRPLDGAKWLVIFVDGFDFAGHTMVGTLGVTADGTKIPLGVVEGSTNPVESMIEIVRDHARNVKRWQPGNMRLRWAAAGMLEAANQFRRIKGYSQLPQLASAIKKATSTAEDCPVPVRPAA